MKTGFHTCKVCKIVLNTQIPVHALINKFKEIISKCNLSKLFTRPETSWPKCLCPKRLTYVARLCCRNHWRIIQMTISIISIYLFALIFSRFINAHENYSPHLYLIFMQIPVLFRKHYKFLIYIIFTFNKERTQNLET